MKNFVTIALLAAILTTSACNKSVSLSPASLIVQLLKIDQDANNYSSYDYNADGTLASYHVMHNQVASTVTVNYDANKKPVSATQDNELYKIIYKGAEIEKIEIYDQSSGNLLEGYFSYQYTSGKVTEADYYYNGGLAMKAVSAYDAAGDMNSQKVYYLIAGTPQLASMVTYEYDNKTNPMANGFNLMMMLLGSQPAHNVTKQTLYDNAGNVTETNKYSITYNGNGCPLQIQVSTSRPGVTDVLEIQKFTYK